MNRKNKREADREGSGNKVNCSVEMKKKRERNHPAKPLKKENIYTKGEQRKLLYDLTRGS